MSTYCVINLKHQMNAVSKNLLLALLLIIWHTTLLHAQRNLSDKTVVQQTRAKAKSAYQYCKSKKMNTSICILIDMGIHSGLNRFIIWDFKKDTIIYSCLVSHGCCSNPWSKDASKNKPSFSNQDGSHCSSLGKYKIGARGSSSWGIGIKYLLHGLEPSNSNALTRTIVLHSWDAISDTETYPNGTPEGWGCPSVSNKSMSIIDVKLRSTQKPVLLWVYN